MMKEVFKAISDKIAVDVTAIRWIDFDMGQLDAFELPPVSWPCALISFPDATFENLGMNAQQAEMIVQIRVAFKVHERTHSKTAVSYRNEALSHIDTLTDIHRAIDGLAGTTFQDLRRINWSTELRHDYRVYRLTYSCLYCDMPDSEYTNYNDVEGANIPLDFCIDPEME